MIARLPQCRVRHHADPATDRFLDQRQHESDKPRLLLIRLGLRHFDIEIELIDEIPQLQSGVLLRLARRSQLTSSLQRLAAWLMISDGKRCLR